MLLILDGDTLLQESLNIALLSPYLRRLIKENPQITKDSGFALPAEDAKTLKDKNQGKHQTEQGNSLLLTGNQGNRPKNQRKDRLGAGGHSILGLTQRWPSCFGRRSWLANLFTFAKGAREEKPCWFGFVGHGDSARG